MGKPTSKWDTKRAFKIILPKQPYLEACEA